MDNTKKIDPIRKIYYEPLECADIFNTVMFYFSAIFSVAILFIDKLRHPSLFNIIQVAFLITVVALSLSSMFIRIYFAPRAQESRFKDFLSHAYGIPLSGEQTIGYYNNEQSTPSLRVALQALENCYFSKSIILEMAKYERIKVVLYAIIWLLVVFDRGLDLTLVVVVSQIVFSEQLLVRLFLIEWLRIKFERTYGEIFKTIQGSKRGGVFEVSILESVMAYEISKSNCAITLSSTIFERINDEKSKEWNEIKKKLGV